MKNNITREAKKIKADQLLEQGEKQYKSNELTAALRSWQKALSIYQEIGNRLTEDTILKNIGRLLEEQGQYLPALDYYQQALAIRRNLGNRHDETVILNDIAIIYGIIGKDLLSLETLQEALVINKEIGNRQGEAATLNNIAKAYLNLGHYSQTINFLQQAVDIARDIGDSQGEGFLLNGFANVYMTLGQYLHALEYLEKCLVIRRELKDNRGEIRVLSNIGLTYYYLEDYSHAMEFLQKALDISREINFYRSQGIILNKIGMISSKMGQYHQALKFYQQSLAIDRELGMRGDEGNTLNNIGVTYRKLGSYDRAISCYYKALAIAQEIKNPEDKWITLGNIGAVFKKLGKWSQATKNLYNAVEIIESLRMGLSDANKISIFERQSGVYSLLQQALVAQNKISEALVISERGRARAFVELLIERMRWTLHSDYLISKQALINNEISVYAPTLEEIKQIVCQINITLVEYFIAEEDLYIQGKEERKESKILIWVINPSGEITFCQVDLQSLLQKEKISLSDLLIRVRESFYINEAQLQQLYQILIQPIAHLLPTDPKAKLAFIPHNNLFLVPFPALKDAEGKYLLEKHTIVTAPSIQVLELTQKRSMEGEATSLEALVVGNPQMPTIPLTDPPVELRDLAWAKTEAIAIAPLLNTQAITGADATKAYITQLLPKARLIHLATHGLLDDIRQLGIPGAIALAPSDEDNGFLTAGEIYDMKLNAELVVLSACSTGQGKITGDGVIGLSRCLIAAGVKSVIVSLWSVDDLSTALLMVKFYQIFQQRVAATIALNEAQRWLLGVTKTELSVWLKTNERFFDATLKINLRRRLHQLDDNAKLFHNPRYWGAFCAIGQ